MHSLFISGFRNTGKTISTARIGRFLLNIGYIQIAGDPIPLPGSGDDFMAILHHPDISRRILINTRSDYADHGAELLQFYRLHEPIDIVITCIREAGIEREAMENAVTQLAPIILVEIPLAKINGNRSGFQSAFDAFLDRVERLSQFILMGDPFRVQG